METPCLYPSEGHKHGCRKVSETSVVEMSNLITLGLRHVEINISSSARNVQLAKTKAITHVLTHATAFSGSHFSHATQKVWKFKRADAKRRTLSS